MCLAAGAEVLVSGPICWDTDLQLPDSWVRAINSTDLPEEQPLLTRLEVSRQFNMLAGLPSCVGLLACGGVMPPCVFVVVC